MLCRPLNVFKGMHTDMIGAVVGGGPPLIDIPVYSSANGGTTGRIFEIHRKFLSAVVLLLLIYFCGYTIVCVCAWLVFFFSLFILARGKSLRAPTDPPIKEKIAACQTNFKFLCLTFCPLSCRLDDLFFCFPSRFSPTLLKSSEKNGDGPITSKHL